MNGNAFLDKMTLIDPQYIEEADRTQAGRPRFIRLIAAAASVLVIAAVYHALPYGMHTDANIKLPSDTNISEHQQTDPPSSAPDFIYNEADYALAADRQYALGCFYEKLSQDELSALLPNGENIFGFSGSAFFSPEGGLIKLDLFSPEGVHITMSESPIERCYIVEDKKAQPTVCGSTEYMISRLINDALGMTFYEAETVINDIYFLIELDADNDDIENLTELFQHILITFADEDWSGPDLSKVSYEYIPEYFDLELGHEEAAKVSELGGFFIKKAPLSFSTETIRHHKDQNGESLHGLWTKGYDELFWNVRYINDSDKNQMTHISEYKNYDMTLYSIPLCDSVPDELINIVNDPVFYGEELTLDAVRRRAYSVRDSGDSDGIRINFSVRYDDIIVEVRAKGIEPEWIFEQIAELG